MENSDDILVNYFKYAVLWEHGIMEQCNRQFKRNTFRGYFPVNTIFNILNELLNFKIWQSFLRNTVYM